MSTKINVRSPFFLHLTEPTKPLPTFTCFNTAYPNGRAQTGFAVDDQGIVTEPSPSFGFLLSYDSTAGDFANSKFATVSTATARTINTTLQIPDGFANTSDGTIVCPCDATQPPLITVQAQPSDPPVTCTPTVTNNGSIPAVTLDTGGNSTTIDLAPKFNNETVYDVSNSNPTLVSASISGSNLILSSNVIGGSTTVYAIGRDGNYPSTCQAVQSISVTINSVGEPTFTCNSSPLTGGSITQGGAITRAYTTGDIQGISLSNGGSLLSPEQVAANSGSGSQSVTLHYRIKAPAGYTNAGATLSPDCTITHSQPGTGDKTFTCDIAGLSGQSISKNGSIFIGTASEGTVKDFTAPPWLGQSVSSNTVRTVTFQVEIPSGYTNAGTLFNCNRDLTQPGTVPDCGLNEFYISDGKEKVSDFCDKVYATNGIISSTVTSIGSMKGTKICKNGVPFNGGGFYYGIYDGSSGTNSIGLTGVDFKLVRIDSTGIVLDVRNKKCQTSGSTDTDQGSVAL
tara:strand:- start:908 stop:2440 length:1533 start_codon:yes stop_codon:yes gene_type:complete